MSRPTSVRLDEHFQTFIATLLREGRYRSADQVVHAGRALLEHQTKLEALRTALGKGERSGFIEEKLQGEGVEAIEPRPPPHR